MLTGGSAVIRDKYVNLPYHQRLMEIRMGGAVERCHTVRHHGSYSVAAHSWGVAVMMYILWPQDFPHLVPYCLFHDVPEAWVGDVPAPTKFYDPAVKQACDAMEAKIFERLNLPDDAKLTELDRLKLKMCDSLELYAWAHEQLCAGNKHARCVIDQIEGFYSGRRLLPQARDMMEKIKAGSAEYNLCAGYNALFKEVPSESDSSSER